MNKNVYYYYCYETTSIINNVISVTVGARFGCLKNIKKSVKWWIVWCLTLIVSECIFSDHGLFDPSFKFQHGAPRALLQP